MFKSIAISIALTLSVGVCAKETTVATTSPEEFDPRPDVVVVLIDTLRPDHLGFYGYGNETAPFMAGIAQDSAVFHRAFSTSSWTAPAVASVFTGMYPTGHGIIEGFMAYKRRSQRGVDVQVFPLNQLPAEVHTMAEYFKSAGYQTFGIATNLNVGPEIGFNRAFDKWHLFRKDEAEKVSVKLDEWEEELRSSGPKFVYLHFMDPHMPYNQRAPWYEKQEDKMADDVARYDSEIRYLDGQLESILRKYGWDKSGILAFVSDHGEEFGDHGGSGHEFQLYTELNRVLMMVRPSNALETTRDIHANVSLVDLLPTLLADAGIEVPPGLDGQSLLSLMQDQPYAEMGFNKRTVFAHRIQLVPDIRHKWSAIKGRWKLIHGPGGDLLFDLREDFGETKDLSVDHPEILAVLRKELEQFRARGFRSVDKVRIDADESLINALSDLGYYEEEEE